MFVIALDGVLRGPTGVPIRDGVWLLASLEDQQVVIASDGPVDDAQRWLRQHNLLGNDEILGSETEIPDVDLRLHQVRTLRSRGAYVHLVVESDPHRAVKIMAEGVSVAVFAHPTYSRPDRRLTRPKAVAWERIVGRVNARRGISDEV